MPTQLRKIFFWFHLIIGLSAGLVIALTALTGAIMSFEHQILGYADRAQRLQPTPAADAPLKNADELLALARAHYPENKATALTLHVEPTRSASLNFKGKPSLFIDTATGEIKPQQNQKLRAFFSFTLRLHRWLALPGPAKNEADESEASAVKPTNWKSIGESIVGVSALVFFLLTLTGLFLWWPRHWSFNYLRAALLPRLSLRGKARDWNWHNALGFLAAPALLVMTFTGLVITYDPLANWISPREGRGPPQSITPPASLGNAAIATPPLPIADLVARAQTEIPGWSSLTVQFEDRRQRRSQAAEKNSASPVGISIQQKSQLTPIPVRLSYHPFSGELLSRSELSDQTFRRAFRTLNLPLHMGTALGWPTQLLALLACLAALVLVYTGFALAYRRFFGRPKTTTSG